MQRFMCIRMCDFVFIDGKKGGVSLGQKWYSSAR